MTTNPDGPRLDAFDRGLAAFELLLKRVGGTPSGLTHDWVLIDSFRRLSVLSRQRRHDTPGSELVLGAWPYTWEVGIPADQEQPPGWQVAPFLGADEEGRPLTVYAHVPTDAIRAYIRGYGPQQVVES